MTTVRVQILGPVRIWRGGTELVPTGGGRTVLARLALASGGPVSRAELVDLLWPDRPPASAANVLQTHVKRLRQLLEPGRPPHTPSALLPGIGDGYALRMPGDDLDLAVFRRLVAAADGARRDGDPASAARSLDEALRLWPSRPLADAAHLVNHPKAVALAGERLAAVIRYGEAAVAAGTAREAIPVLEEAAGQHPLDELVHAWLILAYGESGRRSLGFNTFHGIRRRLADELGTDPGPELSAAHTSLLGTGTDDADDTVRQPVPAQLPADVTAFVGRAAELAELDRLGAVSTAGPTADAATGTVITLVCGTAGVGKTALAIRWAQRVRDRFPDGQLYLNLRGYDPDNPMSAGDALAMLLHALGCSGDRLPREVPARAAEYRTRLDGRRMLIVLDNASTVDQVRPLLPGGSRCLALVTSRDTLPGLVARDGAARLDLDLLPEPEAQALLRRLIGPRVDAEPEAAAALIAHCARLPLALRVAAELATGQPGTPLSRFAAQLGDERRRLDLLDPGDDPHAAVRPTFSWSYRFLPQAAARAFRMLGLHPGPTLDGYALAALGAEPLDRAQAALTRLARAHLVHPTGPDLYAMHDLLRAYAAETASIVDGPERRRAALTGLMDYYHRTVRVANDVLFPGANRLLDAVSDEDRLSAPLDGEREARAWLDTQWPNLAAAIATAASDLPGHATALMLAMARYLMARGQYPEAIALYDRVLDAARALGDKRREANLLTNKAILHLRMGQYGESTDHLRQAHILCQASGDLHTDARALGNLGVIHMAQGEYDTAADYLRQAGRVFGEIGDRVNLAVGMSNLGMIYDKQGHHELAAEQMGRALAVFRDLGNGAATATTLSNLALVLLRQGHLDRAEREAREAVEILEPIDRHTLSRALDSLGQIYLRRKDFGRASDVVGRSLTISRDVDDVPGQACALCTLGLIQLGTGQAEHAVEHCRRSLTLYRGIGDRFGAMRAHCAVGDALCAVGRPHAARLHHRAALALAMDYGFRYEQARAHHRLGDRRHARAIYAALRVPDPDDDTALCGIS